MNGGDARFPSPRFLQVSCVIVPDGNPPPLEWMREHPQYLTISGYFTPPLPPEPNMGLEPQPGAERQAEASPEEPVFEVVIDYAGNWTIRPVPPLTPQPAPWTEQQPEADGQAEPQPEEPTYEEPAPEPEVEPEPPPRPDLRRVAPTGPRRARGGPPALGPNPAGRGIDLLAPEFTRNLVRQTARIMADMDRVMRPGGVATPDGLSAAVRAGMQHLAAHKGDVHAAITSAKRTRKIKDASVPTAPLPKQPIKEGKPAVTVEPAAQPMWHFVRPEHGGAPTAASAYAVGTALVIAGAAVAATVVGAPEGVALAGAGSFVIAGATSTDVGAETGIVLTEEAAEAAAKEAAERAAAAAADRELLARDIGLLRDGAKGKGNFGLGAVTLQDAIGLGESWVGDGYTVARSGKAFISRDGLRQFRLPSFKPKLNKFQANFEQRSQPSGEWQDNGHLDIIP